MASFGRARRAQGSGNAFLRPFAFLVAASLVLLLARDTGLVRAAAAGATELLVPVERVLGGVGSTFSHAWQAVTEIETLRGDNAALRADNDALTLENVRLREQLFIQQQGVELASGRFPGGVHLQGGDDGASGLGLKGRIAPIPPVRRSVVGANYSKVLLVTDSGSAVSALTQNARAAGIVRGQFGDTLVMDWILQTEDVKVGDVVITAGLAIGDDLHSLYPKGLVLGKVADVTKGDSGTFRRAIVVPAVDLRHLENVLVVRTSS